MRAERRRAAEFGLAALLSALGAAGVLVIASRHWQTIVTPRPRPLPDDVLQVTGRTISDANTALGLVVLAGIVAVLATKGWVRRIIGAAIALAGALIVWRSLAGAGAVTDARARDLVRDHHGGAGVTDQTVPQITVHTAWPVLAVVCGLCVLLGGLLVALRGHSWVGMSARYDAPGDRYVGAVDAQNARIRASASLWSALDRGDDPTAADQDAARTDGSAADGSAADGSDGSSTADSGAADPGVRQRPARS